MNLPIIVDVAISMIFVYLMFSVVVSAATEILQHWTRKRGFFLFDSLYKVFNDRHNLNITQLLYNHPLINAKKQEGKNFPSYIQSKTFADALIDVVATLPDSNRPYSANGTVEGVRDQAQLYKDFVGGVTTMNNSDLRILLNGFIAQSSKLDELRAAVISWYDDYMDTVGTWYKRKIIKRTQTIGILVALIFCVDSGFLVDRFWQDENLRTHVVQAAIKEHEKPMLITEIKRINCDTCRTKDTIKQEVQMIVSIVDSAKSLQIPIGYQQYKIRLSGKNGYDLFIRILKMFFGILITGFAISYGADYWFSILGKLINVRSSIKPPAGDPTSKNNTK